MGMSTSWFFPPRDDDGSHLGQELDNERRGKRDGGTCDLRTVDFFLGLYPRLDTLKDEDGYEPVWERTRLSSNSELCQL